MKGWMMGLLFAALIVGYGMGFLVKTHVVFEDGYQYCTMEMNNILKEGLRSGRDFWISGIQVKFSPREDGAVNIRKKTS